MGELGGLLCDYLSEIVPHRMGARAAGAQQAAIKAKFEHSGRPDPTAREIHPAMRNTLDGAARRYPAVATRCRPYTLKMPDTLAVTGTTRTRRAAVGAALVGFFGALRGDELVPSSPGQYGIRNLAAENVQVGWRAQPGGASPRPPGVAQEHADRDRRGKVWRSRHRVRRGRRRCPTGPGILARASRVDEWAGAPFFQRDDGSALTRGEVESLVRPAAGKSGQPEDHLTMHSGRDVHQGVPCLPPSVNFAQLLNWLDG
jgi:hypothetical protein